MTTDLAAARTLLAEWPNLPPAHDRFSAALHQVQGSTGYPDLAVLIRQVLRTSDATRQEGEEAQVGQSRLRLPVDLFPTDFDFGSYGLISSSAGDQIALEASPWKPSWLPDAVDPLDELANTPTIRRRDERVAADPFLVAADRTTSHYRTHGQRAAVRSAMLLDPGDTLLINLPTGTGKTLAMTTPALAFRGQLTVVVVPTVALAQDQARRIRELRPDYQPAAYHGGLSVNEKKHFRQRIENGEQEIVFTNPEAVVTSLAKPLTKAAEHGRLGLFAIDEAHVVLSWGDAFRPHFQALAGFRRHLHRAASEAGHDRCKTILASATLTEDAVALLDKLFGDPTPIKAVQAPSVRPEPIYWGLQNIPGEQRDEWLLEALRHLPRPAIVYTTLRNPQPYRRSSLTPRRLVKVLQQHGFRRVVAIDGGSSPKERERALEGLRDRRSESEEPAGLDLVIANSAFGLGIDIPDVRAVVHACLPEGLDRYYQEVGRGGRDGQSSVSLLLPTKDDRNIAKGMASPKYLTADLARNRWKAMWSARRVIHGDLVRLPLTAVHQDLERDSEFNQKWNLFTLVLLARCSAITWDFHIDQDDNEGWITIRVDEAPGTLGTENYWSDVVEPVRAQLVSNSGNNLGRLMKTLAGRECTGVQIAGTYKIAEPPRLAITSGVACGGCIACRQAGRQPYQDRSPEPETVIPRQLSPGRLDDYSAERTYGRVLTIGLGQRVAHLSQLRLRALLDFLRSSGGCQMFVAPTQILDQFSNVLASRPASDVLMLEDLAEWDPDSSAGVRTAVFLDDHDCLNEDPRWIHGHTRIPLIIRLTEEENPQNDGGYPLNLLVD
jgi:superfamily II DNA/RNA helicase